MLLRIESVLFLLLSVVLPEVSAEVGGSLRQAGADNVQIEVTVMANDHTYLKNVTVHFRSAKEDEKQHATDGAGQYKPVMAPAAYYDFWACKEGYLPDFKRQTNASPVTLRLNKASSKLTVVRVTVRHPEGPPLGAISFDLVTPDCQIQTETSDKSGHVDVPKHPVPQNPTLLRSAEKTGRLAADVAPTEIPVTLQLRPSSEALAELLQPFTITAAPAAPGSFQGTVKDPGGSALPGAVIDLVSLETGRSTNAISNESGSFSVSAGPGHYRVTVAHPGFTSVTVDQFEVQDSGARQVEVALSVGVSPSSVTAVATGGIDTDFPIIGRNYVSLTLLAPAETGSSLSTSTIGNSFGASGNRPQQNLLLLNGVEFPGVAGNNGQPANPQLPGDAAVLEVNVLAGSYGAQYGKRPGAQVSIVTQSGTNRLHGALYEYLRNNDVDARNFFDGHVVPGFQRNQFGGALGAPIRKNKTFMFTDFEGLLLHLHQTGVDLVPDANARKGYLPCTLISSAPRPCPSSGIAFVGVSPLINAWPAPSAAAPDFGGIAEAFNDPLQTVREDFGTFRLDHYFSGKDRLLAVYTINDSADVTPTSSNIFRTNMGSLKGQVASIEETHVLSPNSTNTARVGFSRLSDFFTGEPTPGTSAASLPGFLAGLPLGSIVVGGSAAPNPPAQLGLAGSDYGSGLRVSRSLFTYEDRVSLKRGRNQFTFGAWFQRLRSNERLALSQYGQATFTNLQAFLQGTVSTFLYDPAPTELGWRSWLGAFYAEDVVSLPHKLTLSFGFRSEFTTGWNEVFDRAANYTFTNGTISSEPTVGASVFTANNARFLPQPRVSLAWSPFTAKPTTVIRAGFGIYYDLQDSLGYTAQNAPFNPTYSLQRLPVSQLPISPSDAIPSSAQLVPGGVQPNLKTPTLLSWSFEIQQQITAKTSLMARYIGSHEYHEIVGIDANEPFPVICPSAGCPAFYPGNFPVGIAGTAVPAGTYYFPSDIRANNTLANTWTYFSEGDSSFNAFQVDVQRHLSAGLSLRGGYTLQKIIDDGDALRPATPGGEPALASNPFDLRADRGLANLDVRNVGIIDASYELPLGTGKRFLATASAAGRVIASGWTVSSIVTLQGGLPFTPQLSYNPSNNGDTSNPVRPFVNPAFAGPVILGNPNQWFNPAAFLPIPDNSGFFGNLGRNTLTGPGLANWDLSLLKNTPIREDFKVQFRAEFLNLLNRANFSTPNAITFTPAGVSPTAGLITSTSTPSRQIQFGLKLIW